MPNWKKLIVSGSDASLNSLNVTNNVTAQSFTGSFSGSFTAPGATTQVVYNSGGTLAASSNFVFSGSRIGIGVSTPAAGLEVANAENSTLRLSRDSNTGNYLQLQGGSSGAIYNINTSGTQDHIFQTAGSEKVRITSAGNVGIGTTSPSEKLHVVGDVLISDSSPSLLFTDTTNNADAVIYTLDDGSLALSADENNEVAGSKLLFYVDGSEKVRITDAGNVGIGTASPTQKLDVAGAISVSGSVIDYEVSPALISPGPGSNIVSFTPGTHYAAFVDYVIKDGATGANQRVGTIMVSISLAGAAAVMNEVTTVDIGNTSAITFSVSFGAPTWLVAANSGITPYDINYMVRYF
jgi:hypothetical protein